MSIRVHLDLYSGDTCNLNVFLGEEDKYTFFINFMNTITYSVPVPGELAIWPGEEGHGVDLRVPEWYWWIRADNTTFFCGSNMNSGPTLTCIEDDFMKHPYIEIRISVKVARKLRQELDKLFAHSPAQFHRETWSHVEDQELQTENRVVVYPVNSVSCRVTSKYEDFAT